MVLSLEETTPDFRGLQGLWPAYAATPQEGPSIGMLAGTGLRSRQEIFRIHETLPPPLRLYGKASC